MKTFLYITLSLAILFIIAQAFIMRSSNNVEHHKYIVLKKFENFEIRQYAPAVFTSVRMNSTKFKESSGNGFRTLASYIFGGNDKGKSIAMTSPVRMEIDSITKMSFMVPSDLKQEDLPTPTNKSIYFENEKSKIMAVTSFGGWADQETIEKYKKTLIEELARNKLKSTNKFIFLGYNPPYELFGKRNEVAVELVDFDK